MKNIEFGPCDFEVFDWTVDYVKKRSHRLDRLIGGREGRLVLSLLRRRETYLTEVSLFVGGNMVRAHGEGKNFYGTISEAIRKLEAMLSRRNRKLRYWHKEGIKGYGDNYSPAA